MKSILLHVCCGPCATQSIKDLEEDSFEVTLFFSNSNIHPEEEYLRRLKSLKVYSEEVAVPLIVDEYHPSEWLELVKGHEDDPEGGPRCSICIETRLRRTAEYAKNHGFELFTSTLSISPHKNFAMITLIGSQIAQKENIKFLAKNFKKGDGFKKSVLISKQHDLYRQDFCGCVFSARKKENHASKG